MSRRPTLNDPRVVGGVYRSAMWSQDYVVVAADEELPDQPGVGVAWFTVQWDDGRATVHCTAWRADRDQVIYQPPTPGADAWGQRAVTGRFDTTETERLTLEGRTETEMRTRQQLRMIREPQLPYAPGHGYVSVEGNDPVEIWTYQALAGTDPIPHPRPLDNANGWLEKLSDAALARYETCYQYRHGAECGECFAVDALRSSRGLTFTPIEGRPRRPHREDPMTVDTGKLLRLADHLDTVPDEAFDLASWKAPCGTTCCAVGHGVEAGILDGLELLPPWTDLPDGSWRLVNIQGTAEDWKAVGAEFGIDLDTAYHLFSDDRYEPGVTVDRVARRIREYAWRVRRAQAARP